ncbi:hypothetical protein HY009_02905 [Candidatus Acetothermia bacterium]|nr:hypothetical protein [Candidatus Acetothermia bacterium]
MRTTTLKFFGLGMALTVLLVVAMSCTGLTPPTGNMTDEQKIQNAMSAAPMAISKDATILDLPASAGAQPKQLRAGTNGWVCYPDDPGTPANDPICLDQVWQAWFQAWAEKKPFSTKVPGIGYMLQGGADASNTDPFKTAPGPGEQWLILPPHVMWISPDPVALAEMTADLNNGGPWVMWKGTPYQHVMIPVAK